MSEKKIPHVGKGKRKRTWMPHLHIHDEHSIKDGCATVESYADLCGEMGGTSLAITNHGQAAGYARQYFACKERGLKPIFGMEAYVNEQRLKPVRELVETLKKQKQKKVPGAAEKLERAQRFIKTKFRPSRHSIVLAETREGYRNLVRMATDSWLNGFYYAPRTDTQWLADHREGLIYSTACIGGHVPKLAEQSMDLGIEEARRLQAIFEHNFYVEIIISNYSKQAETNKRMLKIANEIGAPCIITCDVHYARPQDSLAQDALLLMRDNKTFEDLRQAKFAGDGDGGGIWQFEAKDLWWRSLEDVAACWQEHHQSYFPKEDFLQAIRNTYALADRIEDIEFDTSLKLPGVFENPEGLLRELVRSGIRYRNERGTLPASGKTLRDYTDRVKRELSVIEAKGFAEYFVLLHDICDHARSIGARMGPGRGSAGGSLIAYLLRITEIDPLRFGLLFERFLDVERSDPPDIDLDFSPAHRDGIKEYIQTRYPATATIGTFGTFKPRAVLTDVGKVFGAKHWDMVKITSQLGTDADKLTWEEIFDLWPDVEEWSVDNPQAMNVVKVLKGLISHRGKNAAGMLVAPASALDEIPMITESTGQVVTAFPDSQGDGVTYKGRELSRLGYLKVDILGIRNVDTVPDAIEILEREEGLPEGFREDLPPDDPGPLNDEDTLSLCATGDVPGAFQLDTHVTRPILRVVGVDRFMDLVMVTALARPGPLKHDVHHAFAAMKRQGDAWKRDVPHPDLLPLLEDSLGFMILQEDVMHVVQHMGGLTLAEANACRKIIGKKLDPETFKPWEEKFVTGGIKLGYDPDALKETWGKIVTFAGYGFNKAHAVAYMITAYKQMYMLTHHPVSYFAALMANTPRGSSKGKAEEKITGYMRAAMTRGIPILPPSALEGAEDFDRVGEAIRFGLGKVKGVGSAGAEIVAARPFSTFEEMLEKVNRRKVNVRVINALIYAGAFDDMPFTPIEGEPEEGISIRNSLLATAFEHRTSKKKDDSPGYHGVITLRQKEREALGIALSWWASNTKDKLRAGAKLKTIKECVEEDLDYLPLLVEVTSVRTHKARRGTMAFLVVSDETGELSNLTFWPEKWSHYKDRLKRGRIVAIWLKREESKNKAYGRWSYFPEDRHGEPSVESVARLARGIE